MTPIKKSQAALEFLTTYAWAILGISILIGSLAYFGILSTSKLLPDRCNSGAEIGCMQYVIKENGAILKLTNNVGSTIIVDSISVLNEGTSICTINDPLGVGATWPIGQAKEFNLPCPGFSTAGIIINEKKKIGFEIIYHTPQGGAAFKKYVQGEVFSTVQQGTI